MKINDGYHNNFECKQCGYCCTLSPKLTDSDIAKIKGLGYAENFFAEEKEGFTKSYGSKAPGFSPNSCSKSPLVRARRRKAPHAKKLCFLRPRNEHISLGFSAGITKIQGIFGTRNAKHFFVASEQRTFVTRMKIVDGKCVFLTVKDGSPFCIIYSSRPLACRIYPSYDKEIRECPPKKSIVQDIAARARKELEQERAKNKG